MTTLRQICNDYEEKTGKYPRIPQINPELLSKIPTNFDKDKGVNVKIFPSTKGFIAGKLCWTCEIMEGKNKGKWSQSYEENLKEARIQSKDPFYGYNMTDGGDGGYIGEEGIEKIARKMRGRKLSEEHKKI